MDLIFDSYPEPCVNNSTVTYGTMRVKITEELFWAVIGGIVELTTPHIYDKAYFKAFRNRQAFMLEAYVNGFVEAEDLLNAHDTDCGWAECTIQGVTELTAINVPSGLLVI